MRMSVITPDGRELELEGVQEFYRVRITRSDGQWVSVGIRGADIEVLSDHGVAVLPKASNMVQLVPVDPARELQGPRIEDREAVASALEVAASNAEHGFNKGADAKTRLRQLCETLGRYAKALRENNGT